jgi:hypothetical protein
MTARFARATVPIAVVALSLAGCGSSKPPSSSTASSATSATTQTAAAPPPAVSELSAAERPNLHDFPPAGGRTLQQLAALVKSTAQFGAATGSYTPGLRRLAFGLNTSSGAFIYAATAVYIAKTPSSLARGPFLATADPMTVAPQYRSKQNAGPGGIEAIYAAHIPLPHPGTFVVLTLTHTANGLIGAPGEVAVAGSSPIPDVGQRPPAIATDTLAGDHGSIALVTTRLPPDDMHAVSFDQVLGRRPVALLFSTPQLCTSRVCGPVTDVAVSLEHEFAGRITFIHEEVYANNQPSNGLRAQMKAFHLQTEPWLFTINRRGNIVARLEGAFGATEVRQALEAALR